MSKIRLLKRIEFRQFCVKHNIDEATINIDGTVYHYINLGDEYQVYREGDVPTNFKNN